MRCMGRCDGHHRYRAVRDGGILRVGDQIVRPDGKSQRHGRDAGAWVVCPAELPAGREWARAGAVPAGPGIHYPDSPGADAFPWGIWGAGHRRPCDAFLWKRMLFLPAVSIGGNDLRRRLRDPSLHCWKRHELAMALSDPVRLYPDRSMVSGPV